MNVPLVPLGDRAFLAEFLAHDAAARWAEGVRRARLPGVADVVLAYETVGVYAEAGPVDLDALENLLRAVEFQSGTESTAPAVTVPVLYDGDDLATVAGRLALTPDAVIAAHSGAEYRVFALGFQPGFPYAGELPGVLQGLPRRESPRTRVPAGSVAIVGTQTAVYPASSPGGWHLIGRTPLSIVDLPAGRFPIRAGDRLRFTPIDAGEYARRLGEPLERPEGSVPRP